MKFSKILIAVDGSPAAEKVAANGFQLGRQLNAEMALISVLDPISLMTEGGIAPKELADILINDLKNNQRMLLEKVFRDHKVWTFVEEGKPYEMILEVAKQWEADLIVMGTHGRTGLGHLLMGSVSEKVMRHSTKPLIIVPCR